MVYLAFRYLTFIFPFNTSTSYGWLGSPSQGARGQTGRPATPQTVCPFAFEVRVREWDEGRLGEVEFCDFGIGAMGSDFGTSN
jgi:hypothetical protein